jgi:hypothetical protein
MVSTIGQAQPQTTQPLWDYERTQAILQSTELDPDLQKLADIINDTSGTYSNSAKVSAYTKAFSSFSETTTEQRDGRSFITVTEVRGAQKEKFDDVIKNSAIGKALENGFQALSSFEADQGLNNDTDRFKFFSKLSDVQKQLPQFQDFGTPLSVLFQRAELQDRRDIVSLSPTAQLLLGRSPGDFVSST